MFERPLLVYSNFCAYSNKFIDTLSTNPDFAESFMTLCIDANPNTKKRPAAFYEIQKDLNHAIKEVPTIIVENGKYVLSGEEAFKWLEYNINKMSKKELFGFNPNEMVSFSDQYSPYGSKEMNDASDQMFRFINKSYDNIETPPEGSITSGMDYEKKQKERDMSFKMMPRPSMNIDFTKTDNFGSSNTNTNSRGNNRVSNKQRDIDDRLEKLMLQREEFNVNKKMPNVNFSNGRIM